MSKIQEIKSYTPPILHTGKDWYIDFYAFNPVDGVMKRKKIKLNFIKSVKERRAYAKGCINRLSEKLATGWNPWIEQECGNAFLLFKDVIDKYRTFLAKMQRDGRYRQETIKSYSSYIVDYPKPKRLGILIGLCTGMRIGEICGLRWENIDVDNKCIHVTHTIERIMDIDTRKTKVIESTPKTIESRRDIPIGRDLLGILKKFKACYNDSFYVTTGDEKFCEPRVYRNYYRHLVLNEVGLDRCIKFHGLRHSFATRMIASKADMKTTSRILGHSDVSTTMNLYVHPSMDDKLDAINKSMKNLFK